MFLYLWLSVSFKDHSEFFFKEKLLTSYFWSVFLFSSFGGVAKRTNILISKIKCFAFFTSPLIFFFHQIHWHEPTDKTLQWEFERTFKCNVRISYVLLVLIAYLALSPIGFSNQKNKFISDLRSLSLNFPEVLIHAFIVIDTDFLYNGFDHPWRSPF